MIRMRVKDKQRRLSVLKWFLSSVLILNVITLPVVLAGSWQVILYDVFICGIFAFIVNFIFVTMDRQIGEK